MNPFVAVVLAVAAVTLAMPAAARKPTAPLNDTGLRRCLVDGALQTACDGTGQDAATGRDVTHPRSSNGVAGFSFVKIAIGGTSDGRSK